MIGSTSLENPENENIAEKQGKGCLLDSPSSYSYQACFCEENIYHLCASLTPQQQETAYAVFITSSSKRFPLWKQKAGTGSDPVVWDYHVILTLPGGQGVGLRSNASHVTTAGCEEDEGGNSDATAEERQIYDFDTFLPWPCLASQYCNEAVQCHKTLPVECEPLFRLVLASDYIIKFSSDRSHMKDSNMDPPPWPLIRAENAVSAHELPRFWDVSETDAAYGTVLTKAEFANFVCSGKR